MSLEDIVTKQYRDIVNRAVHLLDKLYVPKEGWVRTVRTALGMTGPQLAKRLGVSKARVSRIEKDEMTGSLTLKTMQATAEAMGCKFVYAIVPEKDVESIVNEKVFQRAIHDVSEAYKQMALEDQSLSTEKLKDEVQRVVKKIERNNISYIWNDFYTSNRSPTTTSDPVYNYIYKLIKTSNKTT